jgi:hypothetical protein
MEDQPKFVILMGKTAWSILATPDQTPPVEACLMIQCGMA